MMEFFSLVVATAIPVVRLQLLLPLLINRHL